MWRCNFSSKWWFSIAMLVFRGVHLQLFAFILHLILLRSNHTKSSCNSDGAKTWCDSNTSTKRWFRLHILSQLGSIIPLIYQIHIPYLAFRSYFIWSHGFPNSLNSWKFWVSPLLDTQKKWSQETNGKTLQRTRKHIPTKREVWKIIIDSCWCRWPGGRICDSFRGGSPETHPDFRFIEVYMGVSKNRGTQKWMVYNGKPY